jgi:hypothetical protein
MGKILVAAVDLNHRALGAALKTWPITILTERGYPSVTDLARFLGLSTAAVDGNAAQGRVASRRCAPGVNMSDR